MSTPGIMGDSKVILLITFVDLVKKKSVMDEGLTEGQTDVLVKIVNKRSKSLFQQSHLSIHHPSVCW